MDLSLNEHEEKLKQEGRRFMENEASKEELLNLAKTETGYTAQIWDKIAQSGWLGILVPTEYGGAGDSLTAAAVLFEELGRGPLPGPYFSSSVLGSLIIGQAGNDSQKQTMLKGIATGEQIYCLALTEEKYGWTSEVIQTRAAKENDTYALSGVKLFVHNAGAATHFICAARSEEGVSLFVVDRNLPGVTVRLLEGFMGWCYEVTFDSVKVSADARLGEPGKGWESLERAIEKAIPVLCAYMVGGCQSIFEQTVTYSQTRTQFGTPIGRFQRIQDHIVDIVNHLDAARWTTYEALWKLDTGQPVGKSVHLAKAVASEAYFQGVTSAHHVHGGIGYMESYGLTLHTKMSRTLYHQLGEPREHRQAIVRMLGF